MARPQKQTVDYFPHDALASEGTTLTILEDQFGNDGYSFWFRLLERLCSTPGHVMNCRNPARWQFLLAKTHVSEDIGCRILNLLAELDAIDADLWLDKVIWCQNLVDNITDVYKNRRALIPQKPSVNGNNPLVSVVSIEDNPTTAVVSTSKSTQSKLKESKLKESKVIKHKYGQFSNVLLTDMERVKLIEQFGNEGFNERVEQLSLGIESKGYKYKSHYATILAWDRKDKNSGTHKQDTKPIKPTGIRIIS